MNIGLRVILLAAAVLCFLIALFTDENWTDLIAIGLALTAGAFLADSLGWADRTFNSTRDRRTT